MPDPQDPATFGRSRLDWSEIAAVRHCDLLAWYRTLIALRRKWPELADPRLDRVETACDPGAGWLTVRCGAVLVAVNLGERDWACPAGLTAEVLAASDPRIERTDQALVLPPDTVAILAARADKPGADKPRADKPSAG